jgi:1,4-alpha-glucan branching enzyme
MGAELAQWAEWSHESSVEWHLEQYPLHSGMQLLTGDLNALYRSHPALHRTDHDPAGFEWIDANDSEQSTLTYLRRDPGSGEELVVAVNWTPVPRLNYRIGVPHGGHWEELLNTDARSYGGSGQGNLGGVDAVPVGAHGRPYSIVITLPPLATVVFRAKGR